MQVSVMVTVCPAVTVADAGDEHGDSLVIPPSTSTPSMTHFPATCPVVGSVANAAPHPATTSVASMHADVRGLCMFPPHPGNRPFDPAARFEVPLSGATLAD